MTIHTKSSMQIVHINPFSWVNFCLTWSLLRSSTLRISDVKTKSFPPEAPSGNQSREHGNEGDTCVRVRSTAQHSASAANALVVSNQEHKSGWEAIAFAEFFSCVIYMHPQIALFCLNGCVWQQTSPLLYSTLFQISKLKSTSVFPVTLFKKTRVWSSNQPGSLSAKSIWLHSLVNVQRNFMAWKEKLLNDIGMKHLAPAALFFLFPKTDLLISGESVIGR